MLLAACRRPSPLLAHPARNSLELPLLPLPAAGLFARLYVVLLVVHGLWLAASGHPLMAMAMLALTILTVFALRQMARQDAGTPRRLLLSADGRLFIATVGGAVEKVELAGESLWLGSAMLLVLRAAGRKHRVLLGRGNLQPAVLATLRRRLQGAATPTEPAVDSGVITGHGTRVVEQITRGHLV